jgi:hypothetical protein
VVLDIVPAALADGEEEIPATASPQPPGDPQQPAAPAPQIPGQATPAAAGAAALGENGQVPVPTPQPAEATKQNDSGLDPLHP